MQVSHKCGGGKNAKSQRRLFVFLLSKTVTLRIAPWLNLRINLYLISTSMLLFSAGLDV